MTRFLGLLLCRLGRHRWHFARRARFVYETHRVYRCERCSAEEWREDWRSNGGRVCG